MTRATRLLLATAAVCTAALWSMATDVPALERSAVVVDDLATDAPSSVVELVTGPSAHAVATRGASAIVDGRALVAVLAASISMLAATWLVGVAALAPRPVPVRSHGTRLASRAPPRS